MVIVKIMKIIKTDILQKKKGLLITKTSELLIYFIRKRFRVEELDK